jgi:hypothetical protein
MAPFEDSHILLLDTKKIIKAKTLPMDSEAQERVIGGFARRFFPFFSCSALRVPGVVDIK